MRALEFGTCLNCEEEMDCETKRGRLYLTCPVCGQHMKADDWYSRYYTMLEDEAEDDDDEERLSVWDAAAIWRSHGRDEDYMFGYSEEELENA